MKRPLVVGDLQKGECIRDTVLRRIVVSYDIACQWSCNLLNRCKIYLKNVLSTTTDLTLTHLVPKFHLAAHVPKCQTAYSFNFTPHVGRTDGEAPERGWSAANGIASSTKEMGPGSRSDTLDDHFGDYNWRKIITMAESFVRKFDAALPAEVTEAWTRLCQAWEVDPRQPNPFVIQKGAVVTDSDVRLRLAREEADALARGNAMAIHQDISPSILIFQGIQLEDLQQRLAYDVSQLGPHSTSLQKTKVLERSNSLKRRIDAWISIQHLYMPAVALLRAKDDSAALSPVAVHDIKLFMPSSCPETLRCAKNLLICEWQFRYSQAEEILNALRGFLLLRSHMWKSKNKHSRGQKQQTRSQQLLSSVDNKISIATKNYRSVYHALQVLSVPLLETTWRNIFRPLAETDVVGSRHWG
ncbi:hypothetical protein BYT27DRAFT_7255613 [Phlegmacium glaucopus]|nr:hypothetical protein BYT27DRAFT_7255613 [Phlegmacium glaucopus]